MLEGNFEYQDSNARFIRNLYERLWGKAAYRVSMSGKSNIILTSEDLQNVIEDEDFHAMIQKKKGRIGYL